MRQVIFRNFVSHFSLLLFLGFHLSSIDDIAKSAPISPEQARQVSPADGTEMLLLQPPEDAPLAEDVQRRTLHDNGRLEVVEADGTSFPHPGQVFLAGGPSELDLLLQQPDCGLKPAMHASLQEPESAFLLVEDDPPEHPHDSRLPFSHEEALHK